MTYTVTNEADTATFGPFTYNEPGTYTYTATESGSITGVVNDAEATKTITVKVTRDDEGKLTATPSSTTEATTTFKNNYNQISITFPIKKEVLAPQEGVTGPATWSFDIAVTGTYGVTDDTVLNGTVTNAADTATFGPFTYNETGT